MFFSFLYLTISEITYYKSRQTIFEFEIKNSHFSYITTSLNGGAVFLSNVQINLTLIYCIFIKIIGVEGGAFYCYSNSPKSFCNSFSNCTGTIGSSLYQYCSSSLNNFLNYSSISFSISTEFAGWLLRSGNCLIFSINSSFCDCSVRESAGHFGYGGGGNSQYYLCILNKGSGIFGPYSENLGIQYFHNNSIFNNNTSGSLGLLIIWNGNHFFYNSIFLKNIGPISSSGLGSHVGKGSLIFNSCIINDILYGYYTSNTQCFFNVSYNTIIFPFNKNCFTTNIISFQFNTISVNYLFLLINFFFY